MHAHIAAALRNFGRRGAAARTPRVPPHREARRLDRLPTSAAGLPPLPFRSEGFAEDLPDAYPSR